MVIGAIDRHRGRALRQAGSAATDNVLMRVTDWFLVVPFLPLAIVLARSLGPSLTTIIFVIGITSWPGTARIIRAQTLAVEATPVPRTVPGARRRHWHLMSKHVLPNVMPLLLANTT